MSERAPLKCGRLKLVWDGDEYGCSLGPCNPSVYQKESELKTKTVWTWTIHRPNKNYTFRGHVQTEESWARATDAADDLADFLEEAYIMIIELFNTHTKLDHK